MQSGGNAHSTMQQQKKAARSMRVKALDSPETKLNAPIRGQKILA